MASGFMPSDLCIWVYTTMEGKCEEKKEKGIEKSNGKEVCPGQTSQKTIVRRESSKGKFRAGCTQREMGI